MEGGATLDKKSSIAQGLKHSRRLYTFSKLQRSQDQGRTVARSQLTISSSPKQNANMDHRNYNIEIGSSFSPVPAPHDQHLNLYKLLGGEATIRAALQTVAHRMLADSCLSFFVVRPDFEASRDHLFDFFSSTLKHGIPESTPLINEAIADHLKRLFTMGLL